MNLQEFLLFIDATPSEWQEALQKNTYQTFKIPKKNGKYRTIEAPSGPLKIIQRKVARYFQSIYHEDLPDSAHGYILKDPLRMISRDIRTNALTHIGCNYLLNVDLKDFFYQIDINAFNDILDGISLEKQVKRGLRKICLKDKRLPMGAPTSPVLSNLAFRSVDKSIESFCKDNRLKYSRYVDDLSFSSHIEITSDALEQINTIISDHEFVINPKKIKYYGKNEVKLITGIQLDGIKMYVSQEMIDRTEKNLAIYTKLMRLRHHMNYLGVKATTKGKATWKEVRSSIKGHLNFIKLIEGKSSQLYKRIKKSYDKAGIPKRDFEFTIYI